MVPILTLVATLVISLLLTRIGAVALTLTGMSKDAARFQARSAYTGVGFTTSESEQVVNHPVRRRVLATLMLAGNIGIAVVIASMAVTFAQSSDTKVFWSRVLALGIILVLLWVVLTRHWVDQMIERLIKWALRTWTDLDVRDYVSLLHLADGYVVYEIKVNSGDWISGKTLADARLTSEGVLVLGIHRGDGNYLGSPNGETVIEVDDVLSVYGVHSRLEEFDIRQTGHEGDRAHKDAIEEQQKVGETE